MDKKLGRTKIKGMLKDVKIKLSKDQLDHLESITDNEGDVIAFCLGYWAESSHPTWQLGKEMAIENN